MSATATARPRALLPRVSIRWLVPVLVAAGLVVLGAIWDTVSHTRPSFDAFGWLVWGHQTWVGHLNTDGAPSWKPLTYLFTLPYALFGRAQMSLWTLTASTTAIASALFAGRIAWRLSLRGSERPLNWRTAWAPLAGAAFAGFGVLTLDGFAHQVLIATSDPMVVMLTLAAVDAHLSRHPRLAFALLVLAALGRPETWPFVVLYAGWVWRAAPRARVVLVTGLLLIPLAWFLIPGLTSRSWFISGDLALDYPGRIHGSKVVGVADRFLGLYGLPMRVAVAVAVAWAALRRDWLTLLLAAAAILWVLVELAFAFHGWPASPRYMMEAGALLVTIAGAAVGRALLLSAGSPQSATASSGGPEDPRPPRRRPRLRLLALLAGRAVALGAVVVLLLAIVPIARSRADLLRHQLHRAQRNAIRIDNLGAVISREGGASAIRSCGQPTTTVGFQSTLAWELGMNVGDVGYKPGRAIRRGKAIVFFKAIGVRWQVHPVNMPASRAARCARLQLPARRPALIPPAVTPPAARSGHAPRAARPGRTARLTGTHRPRRSRARRSPARARR